MGLDGADGGGGEGNGSVGGSCGGNTGGEGEETTNVATLKFPVLSESRWPRPTHSAPFQPSAYESVMVRAQPTPGSSERFPKKGAPPMRATPPSQASDQPTSEGHFPAVTSNVAARPMGGTDGGCAATRSAVGARAPPPLFSWVRHLNSSIQSLFFNPYWTVFHPYVWCWM